MTFERAAAREGFDLVIGADGLHPACAGWFRSEEQFVKRLGTHAAFYRAQLPGVGLLADPALR